MPRRDRDQDQEGADMSRQLDGNPNSAHPDRPETKAVPDSGVSIQKSMTPEQQAARDAARKRDHEARMAANPQDNTPADYPTREEAPNGVAEGEPGFKSDEDVKRRSSRV